MNYLVLLLYTDNQPGEAKEAAFHAVGLLEEGEEYMACQFQRLLGDIYRFNGEREKTIHHFEVALRTSTVTINFPTYITLSDDCFSTEASLATHIPTFNKLNRTQ